MDLGTDLQAEHMLGLLLHILPLSSSGLSVITFSIVKIYFKLYELYLIFVHIIFHLFALWIYDMWYDIVEIISYIHVNNEEKEAIQRYLCTLTISHTLWFEYLITFFILIHHDVEEQIIKQIIRLFIKILFFQKIRWTLKCMTYI